MSNPCRVPLSALTLFTPSTLFTPTLFKLKYIISVVMLIPLLLMAAISARAQVDGISSSSAGLNINFELDVYKSTVIDIVSSINDGPNRTYANTIPVNKIYGVNVSLTLIYCPQSFRIDRECLVRKLASVGTLVCMNEFVWCYILNIT